VCVCVCVCMCGCVCGCMFLIKGDRESDRVMDFGSGLLKMYQFLKIFNFNFLIFFLVFYFLNFNIFNSYMLSQT
jgi:hypothetical protein